MIYLLYLIILSFPFILFLYLIYRCFKKHCKFDYSPPAKYHSFPKGSPERIGAYGEYLVFKILNNLDCHKKIFTNLYVPINGKTSEIDLILVTLKGIYVFESKNFSGYIFGHPIQEYWIQSLGKDKKNKFHNPIVQNMTHINVLKKELEQFKFLRYTSYVVFGNDGVLKDIKYDHELVFILNTKFLFNHISTHLKYRRDCMNIDEFNAVCAALESYCNVSDEVKAAHIDNIKSKYS